MSVTPFFHQALQLYRVICLHSCRGAPDTLDEKDCGTENNDDDDLPSSQSKGAAIQQNTKGGAGEGDSQVTLDVLEDVDDVIEDFDDDD